MSGTWDAAERGALERCRASVAAGQGSCASAADYWRRGDQSPTKPPEVREMGRLVEPLTALANAGEIRRSGLD